MNKLRVSASPHIRSNITTQRIMLDVIIALLPSAISGVVFFGLRALLVILATVAAAVFCEFLFNLTVKKRQTVGDLSAAVTGLILALNLRADVPIWQCVIGAVFAIVVIKCFFGGLGANFANPAATARVFLVVCFATTVAGGAAMGADGVLVTQATPLENLANGTALPSLIDMFLGRIGGAIGETSKLAILLGFIYLVLRRVINFETPLIFVTTVFALSLITDNSITVATYQILSGGLMFGAVFMATDYVTTPINRTGRMVFAFGCGLMTFLIRYFGSYPEGVSYAILFMNILSPYIEKWTGKVPLGKRGDKK